MSKLQRKKEKPNKVKVKHSFQLSLENENKKIGGVSALVDIVEENDRGRFAVAKYAQLIYSLSLFLSDPVKVRP